MIQFRNDAERALLVGIRHPRQSLQEADDSLLELTRLTQTAGALVVYTLSQEIKNIESATYVGKGKIQQIADLVKEHDIRTVVFDEDLSPRQARNLEKAFSCKVVDRTGLILDIFAQRASSKDGKLQVELAQCIYLMPRLVGQWEHFGRLGGGIGTRGPGETQLEVDRRRVRERMSRLKKELVKVERSRALHRQKRSGVPLPTVALVGYTNAGKSTLMNALTDAGVLVEDQLFATLDPTVRQLHLPSGQMVLLTDTVGFINKLPHQLVEAFKATFEEVGAADILLHVIDSSSPNWRQQKAVVEGVLRDLKLENKPTVEVYNKIDLLGPSAGNGHGLRVSARSGQGIDLLIKELDSIFHRDYRTYRIKIPYPNGHHLPWLYKVGDVKAQKNLPDGVYLKVDLRPPDFQRLKRDQAVKIKVH